MRARRASPSEKAAQREYDRKRYSDPSVRARQLETARVRWSDPEKRRADSEKAREFRSSPEFRELNNFRRRERAATSPEHREALRSEARASRRRYAGRSQQVADSDFMRLRGSQKACVACKESFTIDGFFRNSNAPDGRTTRCRRCDGFHRAKKVRAPLREFWEANGVDCDSCVYCVSAPAAELEHFIPRAAGGTDCAENIFPACANCNRGAGGKFGREPWAWLAERFPDRVQFFTGLPYSAGGSPV